jgi:GTP:adenosylcobinamide-phosphate guanylyltransferase
MVAFCKLQHSQYRHHPLQGHTLLVIRADLLVARKEAVQEVYANASSISSSVMTRWQDNINM